jgi:hypothetical protein
MTFDRAAATKNDRSKQLTEYRYGDSNPGFRTENCL